jgi:hypothetical protein
MSTHGAYICRISVSEHPNADNLALGKVGGFQVVISKNVQDGEVGVFFSSDLKLSIEYANANKLLRKDGGYFEDNLRVRAQSFRKERSEGYYAPLSSLAFTKADLSQLNVGDIITELNGVKICEKYYTPSTLRAKQSFSTRVVPTFPKHYDTEQLAYYYQNIPFGSVVWVTSKLHGTSQRTGNVLIENQKRSFLRKLFRLPSKKYSHYEYVSGTRNTILDSYSQGESSKSYRQKMASFFEGKLHEGEIIYYELVGWEDETVPIMGSQNFSKTKDYKSWGDNVIYKYNQLPGTCKIYVYRITRSYVDCMKSLIHYDLSFPQLVERCKELEVSYVPLLNIDGNIVDHSEYSPLCISSLFTKEDLLSYIHSISDGPDQIDPSHPREGSVVHILTPLGKSYALKYKGMTFKVGEGIAKESDSYIDSEEVS